MDTQPSILFARTQGPDPSDAAWFAAQGGESERRIPWGGSGSVGEQLDAGANANGFARLFRTFIGARAVVGATLVATQVLSALLGLQPAWPVALISLSYAALTIGTWLFPGLRLGPAGAGQTRLHGLQWLVVIGADVVAFSALHVSVHGSGINAVALMVLPVLMAGVLAPRLMALATSAAVTLVLLATAWLAVLDGGDARSLLTQAALAGAGLFIISVLAGELAGRLARVELTAQGNMELALQQAQLNRLVIEEMGEGVMVVDRKGLVRTANPSALRLLVASGSGTAAPFQLRRVPAWAALVSNVEQAFGQGTWPDAGRDVKLKFDTGAQRTLRVRIRFTRQPEATAREDLCVLFFEDVRIAQARTRQEKLAAMGRVSAGIAHEIRNPLSAIAQANALLSEDVIEPAQQRLTAMVNDNVTRIKRIVDDVMELAPGPSQAGTALDACAQVAQMCIDWARASGLPWGEAGVILLDLPDEHIGIWFDADHLRRVLVNLLDNAWRHGSKRPGAVGVSLRQVAAQRVGLCVANDGLPISAEVEPYLFEPFFSTRSRGSGLGLYISRELCERHGAHLEYRGRPADHVRRNEFVINLRQVPLPSHHSSHVLTT